MNNSNISKVAADSEARFGCKGKDKFWFGYKEHASVDAQSGMINKVALTKANITDAQGMKSTYVPAEEPFTPTKDTASDRPKQLPQGKVAIWRR
jgi:hypothetical protein